MGKLQEVTGSSKSLGFIRTMNVSVIHHVKARIYHWIKGFDLLVAQEWKKKSAWWKTQGYILWQPRMSAYASFIIHQIAIEIFLSSPWPRCEPPISKQVSIFSTSPILQESDCPTACVHDIFLAQRVYKAVSLLPGLQLMEGGCFFFLSLSLSI